MRVALDLEFQVRGSDVDNDGTLVDQTPINSADGNPWAGFAEAMQTAYPEGPGNLVLDQVSMQLLDSSSGVENLGEIFNGPIRYAFRVDGTQNEYTLAVADIRKTSTATSIDSFLIEFTYARVEALDRGNLIDGQSSIRFVGQGSDEFRRTTNVADMQIRLRFRATPPD